MGRIEKLSDELANQIAAGEVVERPASIVKELVENSLDAGATRIAVDVEHGGSVLVRVSDDGEGMTLGDAKLSLERHATSKIRALDDLMRIGTFGFRGEALPSIASVSRFTMRTRARGTNEGSEIRIEGGRNLVAGPAGGAVGTTIEIRDLFFNVPARRKFLKATATESAHIGDVVLASALARPDVTFVLTRDGRVVREYLRAASRVDRARSALASETLSHVAVARGPMTLEALLAAPERARAGATGLSLLVNGRPVRDRLLGRAVAQSYGSVLETGRYPIGVVWLDIPPEIVDVNVHPQKAEVRFSDARSVFDAITRELHAGLARAFSLPTLASNPFARATAPTMPTLGHAAARAMAEAGARPPAVVHEVTTPYLRESASLPLAFGAPTSHQPDTLPRPAPTPSVAFPETQPRPEIPSIASPETVWAENLFARRTESPATLDPASPAPIPSSSPPPSDDPSAASTQVPATADAPRVAFYETLRFVGQMRGTFLICEGEDGMYVLDQHAAAERVTFDRLRRSYGAKAVAMQRLLVPELVEIGATEAALLDEHADEVARLGLELRAVGESTVAIHGVPQILKRAEPRRLVRDLASELARVAGRPFRGAVDLVLATMACHGSIRAGDAIAPEEVRALLVALDDVDFAGHCPHGRPIVMRLPWGELERRVGR